MGNQTTRDFPTKVAGDHIHNLLLVGGNPQPLALNDSPAIETERLSNNDTQSLTSVGSYQAIGT